LIFFQRIRVGKRPVELQQLDLKITPLVNNFSNPAILKENKKSTPCFLVPGYTGTGFDQNITK
jgi:hypothetical protein